MASVVVVVELVALVAVTVTPRTSNDKDATAHRLVAIARSTGVTAPPDSGRRVAPTTTVPPVAPTPPTTLPPTPPPPTPAPAPRAVRAPAPTPTPPPVHTAPANAPAYPLLPPANPPANIAPQPDFLTSCSSGGEDESSGCVAATLAAIDNGRRAEALPGMTLPSNWGALTPQEQLYVATNLERTVRGLPPLSSLAVALDQAAAQGAGAGDDPSPPAGFPFDRWGANWAGGVSNPLEAVYYWMYDDGPGSNNADCSAGDGSGCWGHRDVILLSLACSPCVMGTAFDAAGWGGQPSWAEILVSTSGSPAADFTWDQETPYLS